MSRVIVCVVFVLIMVGMSGCDAGGCQTLKDGEIVCPILDGSGGGGGGGGGGGW